MCISVRCTLCVCSCACTPSSACDVYPYSVKCERMSNVLWLFHYCIILYKKTIVDLCIRRSLEQNAILSLEIVSEFQILFVHFLCIAFHLTHTIHICIMR